MVREFSRNGIEFYEFVPRDVMLLDKYLALCILENSESVRNGGIFCLESKLMRQKVRISFYGDNKIVINDEYEIDIDYLYRIAEKDIIIEIKDGLPTRLFSSGNYFSLKPHEKGPPTFEINGIHMHRIEDVSPLEDSIRKVKCLGISNRDVVLDTCCGLGYTAIAASKRCRLVVTCELFEEVLYLASINPWSRELSRDNIVIVLGDVTDVVSKFEDESFSKVLHDPPRFCDQFSKLYSVSFYKEMNRVLRRNGKLFHYVGSPKKVSGFDIVKLVTRNLEVAGFHVIRVSRDEGYVLAVKS